MAGPEQRPLSRMSYPMLHLDMSATNNVNRGPDHRASASPSASGFEDRSRYPPSAAEARDSFRAKRPADSPFKTADKRARIGEIVDKIRSNASSPATSRQNSLTMTARPSPVRRPSAVSSVDVSRDPRRQDKGHAGSASPMSAAPSLPIANGDTGRQSRGNTTPVNGAPTAPPMVPQKRISANGSTRGVASIRQIILQKQAAPSVPSSQKLLQATIQAIRIELKKAKEQTDVVQMKQREATAQREQVEKDLRAQIGHLQEEQEKGTSKQEQVNTDLQAKLNQLQTELETEKKQRLQMEQRLQSLEAKPSQIQNAPADPTLLKQIHELASKVQQLEAQRITELEKTKLENEEKLKQSIEEEIKPISSQLTKLKTETTSLTYRINTFNLDESKLHLDQFIQNQRTTMQKLESSIIEQTNLVQKVSDLEFDIATQEESITQRFKRVEDDLSTKSTVSQYELLKQQLEAVSEPIKSYVDARVEQQVPLHIDSTKSALQESIIKSTDTVMRDLGKDIAEIREEVEQSLSTLDEQGLSTSALMEQLRKDVASDVTAAVRSWQSKISDFVTFSALSDVQIEIEELKSANSSDIKGLRRDIGRLRTASGPSATRDLATPEMLGPLDSLILEVKETAERAREEVENAIDFTTNQVCVGMDELSSRASALETIVTALQNEVRSLHEQSAARPDHEELSSRASALEKTVEVLQAKVESFHEQSLPRPDHEELSSRASTLEMIVKALQDEVKLLHEQASSRPVRTESALISLSTPARDDEATNIMRQDTHAGNSAVERRLEQLEFMLKNLTSRYENITTDSLHQSISRWIQQFYPNAPNFLAELQRIQGEVARIDGLISTVGWLASADPNYAPKLLNLTRESDAIQQLLLERSRPGSSATSEELNSLRNKIDTEVQTRINEVRTVRAEVAAGRYQRSEGLDSVRIASLDGRMSTVESTTREQGRTLVAHQRSIDAVNSTIEQHGQVHEMHQGLINKFNANVATLMVTCYELQKFTQMINSTSRGGGVSFDFSYSFEKPPNP